MAGHPDWEPAPRIFKAVTLLNVLTTMNPGAVVTHTFAQGDVDDTVLYTVRDGVFVWAELATATPAGDFAYHDVGGMFDDAVITFPTRPTGGDVTLTVANPTAAAPIQVRRRAYAYIGPRPVDLVPQMDVRHTHYEGSDASGAFLSFAHTPAFHTLEWCGVASVAWDLVAFDDLPDASPPTDISQETRTVATGAANAAQAGSDVLGLPWHGGLFLSSDGPAANYTADLAVILRR